MADTKAGEYPKFVLADGDAGQGGESREFVIHLHEPRFIAEIEAVDGGCLVQRPKFMNSEIDPGRDVLRELLQQAAAFIASWQQEEDGDCYVVMEYPVPDENEENPLLLSVYNKEGYYCPLCNAWMMACAHIVDADHLNGIAWLAGAPEPYKDTFA